MIVASRLETVIVSPNGTTAAGHALTRGVSRVERVSHRKQTSPRDNPGHRRMRRNVRQFRCFAHAKGYAHARRSTFFHHPRRGVLDVPRSRQYAPAPEHRRVHAARTMPRNSNCATHRSDWHTVSTQRDQDGKPVDATFQPVPARSVRICVDNGRTDRTNRAPNCRSPNGSSTSKSVVKDSRQEFHGLWLVCVLSETAVAYT